MERMKSSKSKSRDDCSKIVTESQEIVCEPKYLTENTLPIHRNFSETNKTTIPPVSPKELIFDYPYTRLPKVFPKMKNLKLPYVRDVGIKACIDKMAEYFRCADYKYNLIQFWFLDMVTDCLWRAQDDYQFPEKHQKVVLEWVLYMFNLIRAPEYNLSRKKIFKLFKEAMVVAEDYIQTGCAVVPLPEELFTLNLEGDKEGSDSDLESESISTDSTISLDSDSEDGSYLAIKFEENTEFFKLPERTCMWNVDNECLSSSEETMSEEEKPQEKPQQNLKPPETEPITEEVVDEEIEFCKPDMSTPPRFQSSHVSLAESVTSSLDSLSDKASQESEDATWKAIPRRPWFKTCPSEYQFVSWRYKSNTKSLDFEPQPDENVLRAWHEYYLWQKRTEDMANPNVGWATYAEEDTAERPSDSANANRTEEIKEQWIEYINERRSDAKKVEENVFINTCVLLAIKQFVFDYFYESFQYTLVRLAFRCHHHLISQAVTDHWHVPKIIKSELRKPKPKKQKKEKVPKEKKPKKEKPPKKAKDKGAKKIKPPKAGKEKKEKPKQLTKEEKAELARLKKEKELEAEKKRLAEMNKRFMFPLSEAATDAFYQSIFENWVKVEKVAKEKKNKKGK